MFIWNDIKIKVDSDNPVFFPAIKKYINAVFDHEPDTAHDVLVEIKNTNTLPEVPHKAKKVKSLIFLIDDEETRMEIFTYEQLTWYIYKGKAGILIDYQNNLLTVFIKGMPLAFDYYNTLIFFLHPLGALLENFGYFRLHSSCISLNGNAMLITGNRGSGKSTSAFSVPLIGGEIISDDLVFIKKTERGYVPSSLTKLVKIPTDSIKRFYPELLQRGAAAVHEDETYYFMEDVNDSSGDDAVLKAIIIVEKTEKPISSHTDAHPSEIVSNLFPSSIHTNIEAQPGRKFVFITDMLNELACKKVLLGTDMDSFYDTAREILDEVSD